SPGVSRVFPWVPASSSVGGEPGSVLHQQSASACRNAPVPRPSIIGLARFCNPAVALTALSSATPPQSPARPAPAVVARLSAGLGTSSGWGVWPAPARRGGAGRGWSAGCWCPAGALGGGPFERHEGRAG